MCHFVSGSRLLLYLMDSLRQALRYGMLLMCSPQGSWSGETTSLISSSSFLWAPGLRDRLKIAHSMLLAV